MGKPAICIDFDGTIVDEVKYPGEGKLKPGVKEAIEALRAMDVRICIYSARNNPSIWQQKARFQQMIEILDKHGILYDEIILDPKPVAFRYVDDRAIKFTDWESVTEQIRKDLFDGGSKETKTPSR